jgi:hypothetical protein
VSTKKSAVYLLISALFSTTLLTLPVFTQQARAVACSESVSTFAQLQSAFTTCNAAGGGTISITADIDTTSRLLYTGSGTLTVQSNLIGTLRRLRPTGTVTWGVIESSNGPLVIDSLELTGGKGTSYGTYGAGVQGNLSITVQNSYIHDNTATYGGGIGLSNSSPGSTWKISNILYSRIESNTATYSSYQASGGYYTMSGKETSTISNSSFMYNQTVSWGPALSYRVMDPATKVTITNSTIAFNRTTTTGQAFGAISYDYGDVALYFVTMYENTIGMAGGQQDIYCGTANQCKMVAVGSIFASSKVTGSCYVNSTYRYATYSVSNLDTTTSYNCLSNINSSGVRQVALEATNIKSTIPMMYLNSFGTINSAGTAQIAINNASSKLVGIVPSSVGSLYTNIDQSGAARAGSMWSAGAYEYAVMASPSTVALNFSAGQIIFRQAKTLNASSNSIPGKITFYANGKRIAGCINKVVNSSNSYATTCTWIPSTRGAVALTSRFVPNDLTAYSEGVSTPVYASVGNRSSFR